MLAIFLALRDQFVSETSASVTSSLANVTACPTCQDETATSAIPTTGSLPAETAVSHVIAIWKTRTGHHVTRYLKLTALLTFTIIIATILNCPGFDSPRKSIFGATLPIFDHWTVQTWDVAFLSCLRVLRLCPHLSEGGSTTTV